jgi:radical SAM superfamily enzyme YgiQ (UPF0313 family)
VPGLDLGRILLVHPLGYRREAAADDIARKANLMPPLGLASLAAWVESKGFRADIVDCFASPDARDLIRGYLTTERPGFIGFSTTTSSFLDATRIAAEAKEILPGVTTLFGGPHVSALGPKVLEEYPAVDLVIAGEGEVTLEEVMAAGGSRPETIPGVICRGPDGRAASAPPRPRIKDLDSLPFPAYRKLAGFPSAYRLPIFNYPTAPNSSCISSRGCPYACSYCDRSVFGRSFRFNSAAYLHQHLLLLKGDFGIRHINFYDDQFTFNRARVEEFCRLMLERPTGMTFNCAVRAEHVDRELLRLMKRAGCWMISLGIETGDPELLARHRQNPDLRMLADTIRTIREVGIRTKGLLMMGLPGETEASIRRSMEYVFSLGLDDLNLAKFTPFPGTPLYDTVRGAGTFDEDWERMDCMNFLFVPEGMTRERLEELFILFYKTHYTQARVLAGYLTMLWKSPDSWRRFIADLGSFWRFAHTDRRLENRS